MKLVFNIYLDLCIGDSVTYISVSHDGEIIINPNENFGTTSKINSTSLKGIIHEAISHIISLKNGGIQIIFLELSAPEISTFNDTIKYVKQFSDLIIPVEFSGVPFPTVEWYKNGELLDGYDSIPLVINRVSPDDEGEYIVKLKNSKGVVTSDSLYVNVTLVPPEIEFNKKSFKGQVEKGTVFEFEIDYDEEEISNVEVKVESNDTSILDHVLYIYIGFNCCSWKKK